MYISIGSKIVLNVQPLHDSFYVNCIVPYQNVTHGNRRLGFLFFMHSSSLIYEFYNMFCLFVQLLIKYRGLEPLWLIL